MANDETRPLPVDGTEPPPAPSGPTWATTQPVVPATPSPYGPAAAGPAAAGPDVAGPDVAGPGQSGHPVEPVQPAQPEVAWADTEPDPWIDITPPRPGEVPAFGAPGPRPAGQGPRVLGLIGLVVAGAVAGALIVNAVAGGGSDTAAVQPAGLTQDGAGANGAAPGGGGPGGVPGVGQDGAQGGVQGGVPGAGQGAVPGGQGLRGRFGGQNGEQRLIGTLTAVSASKITVRSSSGTATYQVVAQTEIVREGAAASVADLKVGDRVLVHVFPASGSDGVLERVIAVPAARAGAGPGAGGTSGASGADDTGTSDT